MSQFPIADLTLLEKALILKSLMHGDNLIIVDADEKKIWRGQEIVDIHKQGDIVQIVVSKR